MSYTVEELNPSNPVLKIDEKEIHISLITLQIEVKFKEKYGSLNGAFDAINKKPQILIDVIWDLVLNKNDFKDFKKFVWSSKELTGDWAKKMSAALNDSVVKSSPIIKNKKRQKEIQDIIGNQEKSDPCYGVYYDAIAKRYGYTLYQFYKLTLKQLHILLKVIGDESYKELEVQAALQGRQLKPRLVFDDISEDQEQDQEQQALDALERLKKDYEKRNK